MDIIQSKHEIHHPYLPIENAEREDSIDRQIFRPTSAHKAVLFFETDFLWIASTI